MKTLISLLMITGIASATSLQRYETWNCRFPNKVVNGPITGQIAQVKFDVMTGKGIATLYPECHVCMVKPQEVAIERQVTRELLIYKNQLAGFYLTLNWTANPSAGYPATMGNLSGKCVRQ